MILIDFIKENQNLSRQLEELQNSGRMPLTAVEFQSARQMMKDKLRLGTKHIFRKHGGSLLQYTDIVQVYQQITKKNFMETNRSLKAVLADKKTIDLCTLKTGGRSDEDMKEIIVFLCMMNPAILVGYKNPSRLNIAPAAQSPAQNARGKSCPSCGKPLSAGEKFCDAAAGSCD